MVGGDFLSSAGLKGIKFCERFYFSFSAQPPPRQALDISPEKTSVTWSRGVGPAYFTVGPEVSLVTFEQSVDSVNYTLLGRGIRTNNGWQITGVTLPTNQNFYLRARGRVSSGTYNGSFGFIESFRKIKTNDAPVPFVLNKVINDTIDTPYGFENWTFSATSGKVVRFDFLNASASGLQFTLRAPSGLLVFTNLTDDSPDLPLSESGQYSLSVRATGIAYVTHYAFRILESVIPDLPLGTNFVGQLVGSGQAEWFRITVTNSGPLRISFQNSGIGNQIELYVARGALPTRGAFDYTASTGSGANQELIIPSAPVGTWYILVYGNFVPSPGNFTIQAVSASLLLTAVAGNNTTLTLTGAGFGADTSVELLSAGNVSYPVTNVAVDSFTQLTASLPPNLAPSGRYSVRCFNPLGGTSTLTNVFEILPPGSAKLRTKIIMPSPLGRHAVATIYVEYSNTGNEAMQAPLLVLESSDPDGSDRPILTVDKSRLIQNYWSENLPPGTATFAVILASGSQPGVLNPGEKFRVPVYYLGLLRPWNFGDTNVEFRIRSWTANDTTSMDWAARKAALRPQTVDSATWNIVFANLTSGLANNGAYVRMLSDNAQFLSRLGQRVVNVDDLWNFEVQQAYGYSAMPVLDSTVDSFVPTPGLPFSFSRRFSSNLRARNSTGPFGRGWYNPWQAKIVAEAGGDLVRLIGEAGSARVFTRDTRNGGYFASSGDSSQLVDTGGGLYQLLDPNGTVTSFRLDGQIDYVEDPNTNRVTASYNGAGRLSTLSHTSGAWLAFGYNASGLFSVVTNSAGRSMTYAYDPTFTYLTTVTTDDGKVTSYTNETGGNNAQRHALRSVTRVGVTRQFTFDTRGRLQSTFLASGDQLVNFGYDSAGGVTVTDAQGTNSLFFDHRGLLAKVTDALGNVTTSEFDDDLRLRRLVAPTGESKSFTWCSCGSPTAITDELGNTTRFNYDNPFRKLTSFTDARTNTTAYAYDSKGNLLSTTYPNNSVERFGDLTASGLTQSYTNRRGHLITYSYSPSGQVARQGFTNGSYADFSYDASCNLTNVTEYTLFGTNKITTYAYNYAIDGIRLRQVTYPNNRWVAFTYDTFGRRHQMMDSTGWTNQYEYDAAGRLWRMRDGTNNLIVEYLYNPAGRLQRINKGNGTYTTYNYDATGQLLHLTNFAPNATVNSRFDYSYDSRGRRRTMSTIEGDWTYGYDGSGQLLQAVLVAISTNIPNQYLTYEYDAVGNRVRTVENGVTNNYFANNLNQYASVSGNNQQYDSDGNLMSDGANIYEWDALGQMVRVTGTAGITQYDYDGFGNLSASIVNGVRTEYLLDATTHEIISEFKGADITRYHHGVGLAARRTTDGTQFFDIDAQGSVVGLSDNGGVLLNQYVYSPFGETIFRFEDDLNLYNFLGAFGISRETSGLSYMHARYYSSASGRFISEDALGIRSGDQNHYRYARNSPTALSDVSGLGIDLGGFFATGPTDRGTRGCGSGLSQWVPDRGLGIDFRRACEIHDQCYRQAKESKLDCDMGFAVNIAFDNIRHPLAASSAGAYFIGVVLGDYVLEKLGYESNYGHGSGASGEW